MKMTKIMIAGGLVLTLGAFSPVFAQSNASTAQNTSYSDNSNTSSPPTSAASATDQGQDQTSSNAQPSEEPNSQQSEASAHQQDEASSNQPSESSKNQTAAAATASALNQQQDRIRQQIRQLDQNLSDAESYEAKAREAWNNNNTAAAQRYFRTAEHILKMATGGGSYQAAMLGENLQQQERMTEKAIKHAKANGVDVSDAEHYYQDDKDALSKGNDAEASRDFRAAQLAAGVPVEVGYAEVWEAKIPAGERENRMASASSQESGTATQENNQSMTGSSTDQKQMDDAQVFLRHGQEALKNGDKAQAQRDFRAAERALSMNDTSGNYSTASR